MQTLDNIYQKINQLFSHQWAVILLIIFLTIPACVSLTKPGFFPTQDYIYIARVYEMNKSLNEGQFPVRWVADFRYGEPLFNYYAPLPYWAGAFVKDLGFSYLVTVKILFALGFALSGITMYYLSRNLFGKLGGLISAVLYIYAPYHSVDVYVRGALSESWALIFFPLIFLFALKISEKTNIRNTLWLTLSLAGLFFTHNIMTILFTPFFFGWCIFLIWRNKNFALAKYYIFGFVLAVGIASTFLLPAFFEKNLVQSDKLITGYFDFRGHFVAIPEFFSTFWGYGASLWGSKDDMSFQVGVAQWIAFAASISLSLIYRKNRKYLLLIGFIALEFFFSLFMQHNQSAPIWEALSTILAFTQFPWRFLGISIFLVSIMGGLIGVYLNRKLSWLIILILIAVISCSVGYFRPESYYLDSIDAHYISPKILNMEDKLPKDYLPVWVKAFQDKKNTPYAVAGTMNITNFKKNSDSASFIAKVTKVGEVEIPITYFPGWEAYLNGKLVKIETPSNLGLIKVKIPNGTYEVKLKLGNTPIRTWSNVISIFSILAFCILYFRKKETL